ncbi:MAG TPA: cation:proton antiporter regulatory subunit [Thermoleophilaceae bacterium]|nr:cation:proton antiporter regulatory subunit [Thermoleophilaceae bacterium]
MAQVEETQLPGVGVRHDFVTRRGERIGMITHRTGHRELLIYDRDDPDACRETLRLEEDDVRALSEMLGGSHVTEQLGELQQSVEGLTIDWVPVGRESRCSGRTLASLGLRTEVSATIVAVLRGGESLPAPPLDFELREGDVAVVVGTRDGAKQVLSKLQGA